MTQCATNRIGSNMLIFFATQKMVIRISTITLLQLMGIIQPKALARSARTVWGGFENVAIVCLLEPSKMAKMR